NACLIPISPKSITQCSTRKQTHWVAIRIDEATQNAGWRIEFAFMSPHRAVVHDPRTYESPNRNTKGFIESRCRLLDNQIGRDRPGVTTGSVKELLRDLKQFAV